VEGGKKQSANRNLKLHIERSSKTEKFYGKILPCIAEKQICKLRLDSTHP
jgi:hypothetical protein